MLALRSAVKNSSLQKCRCIFGVMHLSTETLRVPPSEGQPGDEIVYSPKVESLVAEITKLTLLEVSELSTALKKRLNLPDAPVMAMGAAFAAPASVEEEEAPKVAVQTSFTVKLLKFDDKQKVALIKEVKNLLEGMNLVQAKKFVESAPAVVKADIPKDEAEKLKEAFAKVGGECEIV
ncbi:mitochondrial ribosomal protein L12 [Lycorma delicatula]|uniref:mitochondrial ribosomal protein L12 n=1 Tax=Lycorma delicatula TaxID=130591 RepID=UPI003F515F96